MTDHNDKKIAIVYYQDLHSQYAGGVLTYVHGFIKHAKHVSLTYWGRRERAITKRSEQSNLDNEQYFCDDRRIKFLPEMLRVIYHLWRSIPKIEANTDVVFIQWTETAIPWLFRKKNKPLVVIFHGDNKHIGDIHSPVKAWFYRLADKIALRRADKVIFVSHYAKQYYLSIAPWAKNKMNVIHTYAEDSLIPTETQSQAKQQLNLPADRQIISYAGRFRPPKRIVHMLEVFNEVRKTNPKALLYLAGDGFLRTEAEEYVRKHNLENDVILPGMISQKQVSLLFRASDVSLLLTDFEGTPMSLLESLACGTPVVLSNVSDHKKIVTDGKNGFVVENTDNNKSIAEKINQVLDSPESFQNHARETGHQYLASQVVPKVVDLLIETSKP